MLYSTFLSLVVASFCLNVAAAPAGQPPSKEVDPFRPDSPPVTMTPVEASQASITPVPAQKRDQGSFGSLEDLVFPQHISPSPTSSVLSTTLAFQIASGQKPTLVSEVVAARDVPEDARKRASGSSGSGFGPLEELSFPQMISSSSSSTASSATATQTFGPTEHAVTLDY
ncbi:MAG: hypothetical protein Q9222_004512 [Ikaeria aurantiellina]